MGFNNIFKPKGEQERTDELMRQAEEIKELQELKDIGRDILADQRYQKYRDLMQQSLDKALGMLLDYNHQDNDVYAVNVRIIIQQIKDLMAFLNTPVDFLNSVAHKRRNYETAQEKVNV